MERGGNLRKRKVLENVKSLPLTGVGPMERVKLG